MSSDPAPDCFNTTSVTYHPEGGSESSLQLSDPAGTEATLTDLQCSTSYTITVVATAREHRKDSVAKFPLIFEGIPDTCIVCNSGSNKKLIFVMAARALTVTHIF